VNAIATGPGIRQVRLFHASLVWPLQIEQQTPGGTKEHHWQVFEGTPHTHPWKRIDDEFTEDPGQFRERHYREFVSFLPYVQRFLYGEGRASKANGRAGIGDSPIHIFRRKDIAKLRITLREGQTPVEFDIVHVDLYFL